MTTVPGPKNRPTIDTLSAPEFAADLDDVSAYAALYGNYRAGTNSERLALTTAELWNGLAFLETDTGLYLIRLNNAWVKVSRVVTKTSWTFNRSGASSDSFTAGSFASLAAGTIVNAAQGIYEVYGQSSLQSSAQSAGNLRMLADAISINLDEAVGLDVIPDVKISKGFFTWAGTGDLDFALLYQLNGATGATGTVYKNGTNLQIKYLGP